MMNCQNEIPEDIGRVLDFWFGELDGDGMARPEFSARWFRKDPAFDSEIGSRFHGIWLDIRRGKCQTWLPSDLGVLAQIVVLDQFTRNMFRDQSDMFSADGQALAVARHAMERGIDGKMATDHRVFLYMPFMHSESLVDQERCVALFSVFFNEATGKPKDRIRSSLEFARRHRDIIFKFNRFPHRNRILGRESTPEEIEFLKEPGSSF